jgi:prepilin-type N-terminal cleavage/methylation domain-containing protein
MKRGGYTGVADGFTIVEVMIVLAVSGILFISGVILVNGRQNQTEFETGINSLQSQFQQIINETANNYYPNTGDFICAGGAGTVIHITPTAPGSKAQGTNQGCMLLGKSVQLGLDVAHGGAGALGILPIVGNQYQTDGVTPVQTMQQATPRGLYPANAGDTVPTDAAVPSLMEDGLTIATGNNACTGATGSGACYLPTVGGGYKTTGAAAFLAGDSNGNINSPNPSGNNLASGTQQLSLYAVSSGSTPDQGFAQTATNIGNVSALTNGGLGNLASASQLLICVASASTKQSGLFTISGDGSLNVALAIKNGSITC